MSVSDLQHPTAKRTGLRRNLISLFSALMLTFALPFPCYAQDEAAPAEKLPGLEQLAELAGMRGVLDWDVEAEHIRRSLETVWQQNGWETEADQFARDVAFGVSGIPPWKPFERFRYVTDRFGERYEASDELKTRLQLSMLREASGVLLRHAGPIMGQAREYLALRAAGKPFTPELVAKWMREGQPVLDDMHEVADRLTAEIIPLLSPKQRRILERDLASYNKRRDVVERAIEGWAEGKWEPADWGMQHDPIQNPGAAAKAVPPPPNRPPAPVALPIIVPTRCVEHDPGTWAGCVTEFARLYDLDSGQRTSAASILAELATWATDYQRAHRHRLDAVPQERRASDEVYEPIHRAYAELRARLESLPTTAQRDRADAKRAAITRNLRERAAAEAPPPE